MVPNVVKPSGSRNDYQSFTLKNQLSIIAISDPNATQSCFSLVVRASSSRDPQDLIFSFFLISFDALYLATNY